MLAVSGELDRTHGGATIPKKVRSEFGFKHGSKRRSVYVPAFRNTMHPLLAVFDAADPNLVSGRRNVSTLPTQALYLMNSPFVMAQSRAAAKRLLSDSKNSDQKTLVETAYRWTIGRAPTQRERVISLAYLRKSATINPQQAWASLFQALFASIDFRYVE